MVLATELPTLCRNCGQETCSCQSEIEQYNNSKLRKLKNYLILNKDGLFAVGLFLFVFVAILLFVDTFVSIISDIVLDEQIVLGNAIVVFVLGYIIKWFLEVEISIIKAISRTIDELRRNN